MATFCPLSGLESFQSYLGRVRVRVRVRVRAEVKVSVRVWVRVRARVRVRERPVVPLCGDVGC